MVRPIRNDGTKSIRYHTKKKKLSSQFDECDFSFSGYREILRAPPAAEHGRPGKVSVLGISHKHASKLEQSHTLGKSFAQSIS